MEEPNSRHTGWITALQIGGYSLPATLLLTSLAVGLAVFAVPAVSFLMGSGWMAPFTLAIFLFFVLLVFRKILLRHVYSPPAEADEALLEYFVQQNTGTGAEEEVAAELLENALQLKTVRAKDCMAPRPEIVYIDANAKVEQLRQLMIDSSLSRIIVVESELDNVLGYVHVQQLFGKPRRIRDIVLPISFVPEAISVNDLLHKLIRTRSSIVCVVDEYGSLSGLVTLEDALEQLFGNIDDEHDQEEFIEAKVSETEFIFSGRLKVDDLNEKYPELNIPEGDYNTLSGYLITTTETIPEQGDSLELDGKTFVLELVSDRKIETVRVLLP